MLDWRNGTVTNNQPTAAKTKKPIKKTTKPAKKQLKKTTKPAKKQVSKKQVSKKQVAKKSVPRKTMKGGAVLGKGRDGCVISPPIICNASINRIGKVSKIFDLSRVSRQEELQFREEYEIGKVLRQYDPETRYFLPGIELCYVKDPRDIDSKTTLKDLKDCGIDLRDRGFNLMSIAMPRGQNFKEVVQSLDELDMLKCLGYTLVIAKHCVYNIGTLFADIKGKNTVFTKYKGKYIHPVLIDFSSDYVVTSKTDFLGFMNKFGASAKYSVLPLEIFVYNYFLNYKRKDLTKEREALKKYRGYDFSLTDDFEAAKDIFFYMHEKLQDPGRIAGFFKGDQGLKLIYDKIMCFEIGNMFARALHDKKGKMLVRGNSTIVRLLKPMMAENIRERSTINETLKYITETLNIKNELQLMLKYNNLTKETKELMDELEADRGYAEEEINQNRRNQDSYDYRKDKKFDAKKVGKPKRRVSYDYDMDSDYAPTEYLDGDSPSASASASRSRSRRKDRRNSRKRLDDEEDTSIGDLADISASPTTSDAVNMNYNIRNNRRRGDYEPVYSGSY